MSEDTRKWRPFLSSATSKLNNFKGYLASKDPRPLSSVSPQFQQGSGDSSGHGADPGSGTRQSWTQWAGEKLRRAGQAQGDSGNVVEMVSLFPGWAARRLHTPSPGEGTWPSYAVHAGFLTVVIDTHFDVEIYVAGYASKSNNPEFMSRSQRTFLRLAKGTHVFHHKLFSIN